MWSFSTHRCPDLQGWAVEEGSRQAVEEEAVVSSLVGLEAPFPTCGVSLCRRFHCPVWTQRASCARGGKPTFCHSQYQLTPISNNARGKAAKKQWNPALVGRVSFRHKRLQKRNREGANRTWRKRVENRCNQQRKGKKCFAAKSDKTIENWICLFINQLRGCWLCQEKVFQEKEKNSGLEGPGTVRKTRLYKDILSRISWGENLEKMVWTKISLVCWFVTLQGGSDIISSLVFSEFWGWLYISFIHPVFWQCPYSSSKLSNISWYSFLFRKYEQLKRALIGLDWQTGKSLTRAPFCSDWLSY